MEIFGIAFILVAGFFWYKYLLNSQSKECQTRSAADFWDNELYKECSPDNFLVAYPSSMVRLSVLRAGIRDHLNRSVGTLESSRYYSCIRTVDSSNFLELTTKPGTRETHLLLDGETIGVASSIGIEFHSGLRVAIQKPLLPLLGTAKVLYPDGRIGYMKLFEPGFATVALPQGASEIEKLSLLIVWRTMLLSRYYTL